MPERLNTKRVATDSVQGAESYVTLRRATSDESRELYKAIRKTDTPESEEAAYQAQVAFVQKHIVGWNWVWEDGLPMPSPKDDPTVIGKLSDQELKAIVDALLGPDAATLKN